jgi:hypothetical protein
VIEPSEFQQWLRTWNTWALEVNVWMHNHLEQLMQKDADGRLIPTMEAMWFYQLELAKHMKYHYEVGIVNDLELAEPLLVAAYAEGETTPRFVAVVDRVPMADSAEIDRHRARQELEGGSDQAELTAGSLEALVWEPAASHSPLARRTDLAELDAWLLEEMHCTYMLEKNSFREVGVLASRLQLDSDSDN